MEIGKICSFTYLDQFSLTKFLKLQFYENSSFEAKNITCDFLHESSFLAIEITKDIFADDKKCKKVQESGIKRLFCIF